MPFSISEIEAQMKILEQIWIEMKRKGEPIPENAIDSLSLVHYNQDLIPAIFLPSDFFDNTYNNRNH